MGGLVNSLTNLCKLLECLIKSSLKPDLFRLSKQNKLGPEQIHYLWDVTHKLCCFSTADKFCSGSPYKCIEECLRHNRGVAAFFLSPDATARQLLLSFGFLLSERIIERNIDSVLIATPLGEELPSFMVMLHEDYLVDSPSKVDDPLAVRNYISYACGKLKHNLRYIANNSQEKAKLFSKVHKATASAHGAHTSVGDLLMAVQPELQPEFLSRCQHCIPLLHAYSKWHKKQNIFWEWMLTVEEEEFKTTTKPHSVAEITHFHEFLRRLKSDIPKTQIDESGNSSQNSTSLINTGERRMYLCESGEALDSMIERMNLEITSLKLSNDKTLEQIEKSKQTNEVTSVLQSFCNINTLNTSRILNRLDFENALVNK